MIAAFDIGGTHVSAARVDPLGGTVEGRCRFVLPDGAARDELVARIVRAAAAVADHRIAAAGVAVPGPFDYARGISRLRHKLAGLYGLDVQRVLTAALAVRASFLNDADAFLLGEWWRGAARGHERAVGITLGTGLGSAFLADGRIVGTGPQVPPDGSLHLLSFHGAPVEDRISRRGLLARHGAGDGLDVEDLAERARAGDARAREAFAGLAADLGELLARWLASFGATCVVVGGSIARAWDLLEPGLRPALDVAVAVADNLDDAPLLGAALHAARA